MNATLPIVSAAGLLFFTGLLKTAETEAAEKEGGHRSPEFQSTGDIGISTIDEDLFVTFLVDQRLSFRGFKMALAGPFNVRALDRAPEDDRILRDQDWDDPSDFQRVVPFVSFNYAWTDAFVELFAGPLNGVTVGHGDVASYYFNSTDMDHYQAGPFLRGDFEGNGIEFVMNDFVSPDLLVGRGYLAPLAWFWDGSWPRRVEIGYTLGIDFNAPYRVYGSGDTSILSTGGDISVKAVEEPWGSILPYVALQFMDGDPGLHVGIDTTFIPSKKRTSMLFLQGEYRYVGPDYHPAMFNPFYEENRLQYPVAATEDPLTLADQLRDENDLQKKHGFMLEGGVEWQCKLRIGVRYDTEGIDRAHWVLFRLELSPIPGYHLGGFYAGQDLTGGSRLFGQSNLIGLALRGRVHGPVDLFFHFTRRLRRQGQQIRHANELGGGAGVSVTY